MKNFLIQLTKQNREEVKAWFDKNYPKHGCKFIGNGSFYGVYHNSVLYSPHNNYPDLITINSMSELDGEKVFIDKHDLIDIIKENLLIQFENNKCNDGYLTVKLVFEGKCISEDSIRKHYVN